MVVTSWCLSPDILTLGQPWQSSYQPGPQDIGQYHLIPQSLPPSNTTFTTNISYHHHYQDLIPPSLPISHTTITTNVSFYHQSLRYPLPQSLLPSLHHVIPSSLPPSHTTITTTISYHHHYQYLIQQSLPSSQFTITSTPTTTIPTTITTPCNTIISTTISYCHHYHYHINPEVKRM